MVYPREWAISASLVQDYEGLLMPEAGEADDRPTNPHCGTRRRTICIEFRWVSPFQARRCEGELSVRPRFYRRYEPRL
uniref:Uncharacterized protein n=1 Tax=Hyaloperonospora arabidopsidis (strain Emoy2) TaxID=559515 RepID=M4B2P5_HYAAE